MDPTEDTLNDPAIRAYLHRLVGDEGLNLLERFPKEGEHSDEDLAAKTGINLNSVRHTLYTLYEKRLAEYHRIKNNETGWLTVSLPAESRAIADRVCRLIARVVVSKLAEYGEDVDSCPNEAPSRTNWTPATVLLSVAFAVTSIVPVTEEPFGGEVIATVGGSRSNVTGWFVSVKIVSGEICVVKIPPLTDTSAFRDRLAVELVSYCMSVLTAGRLESWPLIVTVGLSATTLFR